MLLPRATRTPELSSYTSVGGGSPTSVDKAILSRYAISTLFSASAAPNAVNQVEKRVIGNNCCGDGASTTCSNSSPSQDDPLVVVGPMEVERIVLFVAADFG